MTMVHPAKLAVCVVASVVLHSFFLTHTLLGRATKAVSNKVLHITVRSIDRPSLASQPPDVSVHVPSTKNALSPQGFYRATLAIAPSPAPNPDPTELDVQQATGGVLAEHFFSSSEVDTPAAPETNWPIAIQGGFARSLSYTATVSIWINSAGKIEKVQILSLQPDSERVRTGLLAMEGAIVQPAMLRGVAVANQRNIEMQISP